MYFSIPLPAAISLYTIKKNLTWHWTKQYNIPSEHSSRQMIGRRAAARHSGARSWSYNRYNRLSRFRFTWGKPQKKFFVLVARPLTPLEPSGHLYLFLVLEYPKKDFDNKKFSSKFLVWKNHILAKYCKKNLSKNYDFATRHIIKRIE